MNEAGRPVRVLIVARRPFERAGLRELLAGRADVGVVAESASLEAALQADGAAELDAVLAVADGLRASSVLAPGEAVVTLPILLLGEAPDPAELRGLLRRGIRGFLLADATPEEIAAGLLAVSRGLLVLDAQLVATLGPAPSATSAEGPTPVEPLTDREREVLELMGAGLPNKTIAARLGISEHTVKFHVGSIAGKLGASSRTEAVTLAIRRGLLAL